MKLHILVGQRHCSHPGQYAPEALAVADEYTMEEDPKWLEEIKMENLEEFDALTIMIFSVKDEFITAALYPPQFPVLEVVPE